MKALHIASVIVLAALVSACAGVKPAAAPPAATVIAPADAAGPASAAAPADQAMTTETVGTGAVAAPPPPAPLATEAPAATAAAPATGTSEEADFAAIYGQDPYNPVADPTLPPAVQAPRAYDPWEKFNRKVHRFNNAVDRTIARPLARAYVEVTPRPVRLGVSNFFNNLGQPLTMVNSMLQGEPRRAAESLGRFLVNSTLGIAGIFDPASDLKMGNRSEDFGQTLGVWGWKRSRYVELPLFGPRTVRDVFGLAGDAPLSPLQQVEEDKLRIGLQGLQLVDVRAQLLAVDAMRDGAVDEYALTRDSWLQRRNYQIGDDGGKKKTQDPDATPLPDYLLEEEANPTVPMDAMPVVIPQGGG